MNLTSVREGAGMALDALRSNRARAALTILGIVIGVATVVAMAAVIGGVRGSVMRDFESMGPDNFVVARYDRSKVQVVNDGSRPAWEGTPRITDAEARRLAELPSLRSVTRSVRATVDVRNGPVRITGMDVRGSGADWPTYTRGDMVAGRNFLPSEVERSALVAVLSEKTAESVFGREDAVGRQLQVGPARFTVVGVYRKDPDLFSSASAEQWLVVPHTSARKHLQVSEEWSELQVVPAAGVSQEQAMDEVTAALREARGLRPTEENDFALIRQEAFSDTFDQMTAAFFVVMLVLSSIGLVVGGVGVVAIMMISVTERTREIGVRKALGATRREILWQFLVESVTMTVLGGMVGLAVGGGGALLLSAVSPIPAQVPLWSVVAGIAVSAVTGIGFGLYPANRAARLHPVEALRYE